MANRLISPSLADVSQDIAGVIPIDIILKWGAGRKNSKYHIDLLNPFKIKGTVVSSDSAGLSRLTQNKTLLQVMKMVNEPKEVIFKYGKAIGGKEIGIWAADNTEMFYEEDIDPSDVIVQMVGVQKEVKNMSVQIGLGLHFGQFISIGGGLFGDEADFVEDLAENHASAGEIVLTSTIAKKLSKSLKLNLIKRDKIYKLDCTKLNPKVQKSGNYHYPYPFTNDFFQFVRSYKQDKNMKVYKKYSKEKIVILVKVVHKEKKFLLDELSDWVLANTILKKITLLDQIEEIKSNGSLGIFVTDNVSQAIDFAVDLKDTMSANGYIANIGISKGEVLIFPLGKGIKEIAGGPVNIASKMAEDGDGKGEVLIEDSISIKNLKTPPLSKFKIQLSSVELRGYKF